MCNCFNENYYYYCYYYLIQSYYCYYIIIFYTLSGRTGSALVWHSEVAGSRLTQCNKSCDLQHALQCAIRGAQGVLPCVECWGATSQLDLPSLTPLTVAGCG